MLIDASRSADALAAELDVALDERRIPHGRHYDTWCQARRWVALAEALSPARLRGSGVGRAYDDAFARVAARVGASDAEPVTVVSLGCGDGAKDAALIGRLAGVRAPRYVGVDGSAPLVLAATAAARAAGAETAEGVVADVAAARGLTAHLDATAPGPRIVALLGLVMNLTPAETANALGAVARPGDLVVVSANLAPGDDYAEGVAAVVDQYDNAPTRRWVVTALADLDLEADPDRVEASVAPDPAGTDLLRVELTYPLSRAATVDTGRRVHHVAAGERLRLLFSYRHTPDRLAAQLAALGVAALATFAAPAGEECVLLGVAR